MQFDILLELEPAISESEAEAYLLHGNGQNTGFPAVFTWEEEGTVFPLKKEEKPLR